MSARYNLYMEGCALKEIGENEKLLLHVCKHTGARLKFRETVSSEGVKQVSVAMSGLSRVSCLPGSEYEFESLPKASREDACMSIIRQMLFPEVAKTVGVPEASSADELCLKLEIACPS